MSDSEKGGDSGSPGNRFFVIGLVALGLLIAAFALPVVDNSSGSSTGGTPFDRPDGDGEPREIEWDIPVEWVPEEGIELLIREGGELLVTEGESGGDPYQGCAVVISEKPTPGSDVRVYVWNDGDTVADVPVWFDGELQGRTDAEGRVVGTVSYSGELEIEVSVPGAETCLFLLDGEIVGRGESTEATTGQMSILQTPRTMDASGGFPSVAPAGRTTDGPSNIVPRRTVTPSPQGTGATTLAQSGGNYSTAVPVEGEISIAVRGDPYPGESIDIRAEIDGEEVPDANVSVDGKRQTETDGTGRATVVLPDDGSETTTVSVERGDFSGSARIEMLIAELAIEPVRAVPLPGQDAEVVVTMGDRTVSGTAVLQNGTALGTTGPDGRLTTTLPRDPLTAFSTTVRGQTATTHVVWAYLPTFAVGFVLVLLLSGSLVAAGIGGRRWFLATATAWVSFFASIAGYVLGGTRGLFIVDGVLAAVLLFAGLVIYRERAAAGATTGGRRLRSWWNRLGAWLRQRSPVEWVKHATLRVAEMLGQVGGAIADRIRDHSVRSFLCAVVSAPRALLGRAGKRIVSVVPPVALAVGLAVLGIVTAVAYYVGGVRAAAVAGLLCSGLVAVGIVATYISDDESDGPPDSMASTPSDREVTNTTGTGTHQRVTHRRLWRTLARWVVPGRWRSQTPGEVERKAIEKGYPAEPVEELTRVFRDIEYGNQSLTADRWQATKAAFLRLAKARKESEEEEPR